MEIIRTLTSFALLKFSIKRKKKVLSTRVNPDNARILEKIKEGSKRTQSEEKKRVGCWWEDSSDWPPWGGGQCWCEVQDVTELGAIQSRCVF